MRWPRWVERMRAARGGYYWAPCPVCGRWYGGHEEPKGNVRLPTNDRDVTTCTCPKCAPRTSERNRPWDDMEVVLPHPAHVAWQTRQGFHHG